MWSHRRNSISGCAIRRPLYNSSRSSEREPKGSRSDSMVTQESGGHPHPPSGFIRKYIFSLDHKVIGIQYYVLALFSVFVGMALSLLMRIHLVWPSAKMPFTPGGQMTPEQYLALLTMHGSIMIFMVLTTAPQSGFGNFILPIQIGAEDMAFPVLNMLSFWVTFLSLVVLISAFFVTGGAPISGWTAYPPLSALGQIAGPGQGAGQTLWVIGVAIFCIGALLGALNFITTTVDLRAKGMTLGRMPLTVWAWLVTAILGLLAFGVLLAACLLRLLDRVSGAGFFLPGGLVVTDTPIVSHTGGSPLLWQHLFWFFGHPEVYIAILPGMGVTSHVLSTFSRKPVFGYKAMVGALSAIGFLGFCVWGHHMFISGMSPYSAIAFSLLTMAIGVPSAIKTFNWLGTLWGGRIRFTSPMLFAIGFVSLFVTGGGFGVFLAQPSLGLFLHDGYFVEAHLPMIMGVGSIFRIFTATYYWFPKMFRRIMSEGLGKLQFWRPLLGAYGIFMPMHFLGMVGHPRRYPSGENFAFLGPLQGVHLFISIAAFITMAGQLIFLYNFFWSMKRGKKAEVNPWHATTLEWTVPSPPPHDNFAGHPPAVYRGPYEYAVPDAVEDYVPQHLAPEQVAKAK